MPTINYLVPKNLFLHLALLVLLTVSVVAGITVAFQLINIWLPDVIDYGYGANQYVPTLHSASAFLTIGFPALLLVAWAERRFLTEYKELMRSRVRVWMLTLVLFVLGMTIVVDLIVLVHKFYAGEITTRFLLKILVVLVVAALVLGYERWKLRAETLESRVPRIAAAVSAVVAIALIVTGFFVADTPSERRAQEFDRQRVSDLRSITYSIEEYKRQTHALPESLMTIPSTVSYNAIPRDPETGELYQYTSLDETTYTLCATFNTEKNYNARDKAVPHPTGLQSAVPVSSAINDWSHPAGDHCFTRTIFVEREQ